jgi:hydroxymethylglutaryl-CoA reductase
MERSSRISRFYSLSPVERQSVVADWAAFSPDQRALLADALALAQADKMVENVVGTYALPLGIATNFMVNDRDVLVPMVIEEPSVVAGASLAARLARAGGGFWAETTEPLMIGQIQVLDLSELQGAAAAVLDQKDRLIDLANSVDPVVVSLHGGARDVEVRTFPDSPVGPMLVVHLIYDCRDAMGANMVNTACEALAPLVAEIAGGRLTCGSFPIWQTGAWPGRGAWCRPVRSTPLRLPALWWSNALSKPMRWPRWIPTGQLRTTRVS